MADDVKHDGTVQPADAGDVFLSALVNIIGWAGCAGVGLLAAVMITGKIGQSDTGSWLAAILITAVVGTSSLVGAYRIDKRFVASGNRRLADFVRLAALVVVGTTAIIMAARVVGHD